MATFQPADNLRSRTFLGLLVAQFFAAFNDQAIHASAMFFAIRKEALHETKAIILMPILFYAPWALFSTLAGWLADRYSKQSSLLFWKVAEIGITGVALVGFWLGTHGNASGPWIVLSTVFLMGMHSAFFVPAKYGVMPEILQPHMLSRGNGVLESLSFLAVILGTVCGGILSDVFRGREYLIGAVLVVLAVVGAVASLLICRMPAANPGRPFPPYLYGPLYANIRALLRSRPLAFAVIGIAFFTFIVAFMRATVYLHGQVQLPRWTESKTSEIVGMVALGIGLGSPFVGFLSGGKVELGLVPVGAIGMVLATLVAAATLGYVPGLIACIVLIGAFTGFYIVPLFTLLQHRAPKTSKGDAIATSNFINVTGAIAASIVVFAVEFAAHQSGLAPRLEQTDEREQELRETPVWRAGRPIQIAIGDRTLEEGARAESSDAIVALEQFDETLRKGDRVILSQYKIGNSVHYDLRRPHEPQEAVYDDRSLPRLLFVGAALMTLVTLLLLSRQMPDLFLRTVLWFHLRGRYRLNLYGSNNLPGDGAVVLMHDADSLEAGLHVLAATDRTARFLLARAKGELSLALPTRLFAAKSSILPLQNDDWGQYGDAARDRMHRVLRCGDILGMPLLGAAEDDDRAAILADAFTAATTTTGAVVVPVHYEADVPRIGKRARPVHVVFGAPIPAGTSLDEVRHAVQQLGNAFREQLRNGTLASTAFADAHR